MIKKDYAAFVDAISEIKDSDWPNYDRALAIIAANIEAKDLCIFLVKSYALSPVITTNLCELITARYERKQVTELLKYKEQIIGSYELEDIIAVARHSKPSWSKKCNILNDYIHSLAFRDGNKDHAINAINELAGIVWPDSTYGVLYA